MIEKKIEIYADEFIRNDLNNAQLLCELNSNYAILALSDISDKKIAGYEYFEFDALNGSWNDIFNEMKLLSKILTSRYNTFHLFYNFSQVLVVPALYDNDDSAETYLNTFYNSLKTCLIESDKLSVFDNISVVYFVEKDLKQAIQSNFNPASVYHSYSKLLQNIFQTQHGEFKQCFHLFFYNQMFVIALTDNVQLKFIKSVNYHSAEDVLYFVLNVAKQYRVNTDQLQLKVSGFINYDSEDFIVLQKHFAHIAIEEPPVKQSLNSFFKEFPKHYFTPFLYLLA